MKSVEYKCDSCGIVTIKEVKCSNKKNDVPENWITMDLNFYNNNQPSETTIRVVTIASSKTRHFCSKKCFVDYFFYSDEEWKGFQDEKKKQEQRKKLKPTNLNT
jgi:hypothetical protein